VRSPRTHPVFASGTTNRRPFNRRPFGIGDQGKVREEGCVPEFELPRNLVRDVAEHARASSASAAWMADLPLIVDDPRGAVPTTGYVGGDGIVSVASSGT
jgi:hypothetical protein